MPSEAKRVNITISEAAHERLRELVDALYGGNFSRFVSDAAIFYAATLGSAGQEHVAAYVAARRAHTWIPNIVSEKGSQVSVLMCNYCGDPNPQQLDALSADTVNVICPSCGNEQVLKGFRPATTWIPPAAAVHAFVRFHSGKGPGALDPPAIELVKRHFAHRRTHHMTEAEWETAIAAYAEECKQRQAALPCSRGQAASIGTPPAPEHQ